MIRKYYEGLDSRLGRAARRLLPERDIPVVDLLTNSSDRIRRVSMEPSEPLEPMGATGSTGKRPGCPGCPDNPDNDTRLHATTNATLNACLNARTTRGQTQPGRNGWARTRNVTLEQQTTTLRRAGLPGRARTRTNGRTRTGRRHARQRSVNRLRHHVLATGNRNQIKSNPYQNRM